MMEKCDLKCARWNVDGLCYSGRASRCPKRIAAVLERVERLLVTITNSPHRVNKWDSSTLDYCPKLRKDACQDTLQRVRDLMPNVTEQARASSASPGSAGSAFGRRDA